MSFADPSVTVGGVASTLPRISSEKNAGAFSNADQTLIMSVSHSYGKRNRRTIRLQQSKVSADALVPSQNVRNSMSTYLVVDTPVNGFSVAEAKSVVDALVAYLSASTGARVTQLLGGEN
jgi:hypothetical protein